MKSEPATIRRLSEIGLFGGRRRFPDRQPALRPQGLFAQVQPQQNQLPHRGAFLRYAVRRRRKKGEQSAPRPWTPVILSRPSSAGRPSATAVCRMPLVPLTLPQAATSAKRHRNPEWYPGNGRSLSELSLTLQPGGLPTGYVPRTSGPAKELNMDLVKELGDYMRDVAVYETERRTRQ